MTLIPALGWTLTGSTGWTWVLALSIFFALAMPIYMIAYWLVKWLRERKHPSLKFWLITLFIWIVSIVGLTASGVHIANENGENIESVISVLKQYDDVDDIDDLDDLGDIY